jgi:glutamyl-tRNA reductase
LLIIDIAVPRSVDPEVNRLENVFLQDIDALRSIIDANLARRRKAAKKVEAECAAAATRFVEWTRRLSVDPTLRELRGRIDAVARQELARTLRKLPEEHHEDVEKLARSLVSKILHTPTTKLRAGAARGNGIVGQVAALREVFGLEEDHEDPDRDER